jgi:predicted nucleic acid-binding protein
MPGFWDASALVPLCVPMDNPQHSRRLLHRHAPVVWWASNTEIQSALARLKRENTLSDRHYIAALQRLGMLRKGWREIQPTNRLRDIAGNRIELHDLRAADALQLAAALVWCNERPKNRAFLCRDARLRDAARREGFHVMEL